MTFPKSDRLPSRLSLHSRVALALAHATVDSQTQQEIISFGSVVRDKFSQHDYVQDLLDESTAVWSELIDHPFPRALANGTAPLNGFRHYMIQDATYLEYYYRVRMEAIGKSGTFEEIKDFAAKLSSSIQYVADAREDCTDKLGVPSDDVVTEPKSQELQNSISLYESVVKDGDWLDIHIVLLPCILGYDTIASSLLSDPETIRNILYFPLWIQANAGGSSVTNYRTFINNNIGNLSQEEREERWPGWVENFKTACGTEKDFFGLACSNNFSAYNIVSSGTYKIRSYRTGNAYLVSGDSSVTTQEIEPQENGIWKLTNGLDGYTIQNVSQQSFLGVSVTDAGQPLYETYVSLQEQPWSINPVGVYGQNGSYLAYQLLVPERLQFALDAGNNVNDPKVFVANNSQSSSQLWLLELVSAV